MQRRARILSRKFQRTVRDVKSTVTRFGRSNSDYYYPPSSVPSAAPSSYSLPSTQDDLEFEPTLEEESSTSDTHVESVVLIPCEFCHVQQPDNSLNRHQLLCSQNPSYNGRRRHLTTNSGTDAPRRRIVSENVSTGPPIPRRMQTPKPSAPPRSRSPSPTEGFTPLPELTCPITQALFRNPVVASDGHTYEKDAIINWLRTSQKSPMTRQTISRESLNPNRAIKKLAEDFRTECKQRRAAHKYILDIDVKQMEKIDDLKTANRTVHRAEWAKRTSAGNDSKIILTHLIGDHADKLGEDNVRLGPHPHIVRTFGKVEHKGSGILLLQEYLPERTLSQLIENTDVKFSITVLDTILFQVAWALQHLLASETIHGNIMTDDIFIYQLDEDPEKILVKLLNTRESEEPPSEKSDVYAFGLLARALYTLELSTNDEDLTERQNLVDRCTATDPDARPTLNELTKLIIDLIQNKKFLFE